MTWPARRDATMPVFLSVLFLPCLIIFAPQESLAQDAEPFLSLGETRALHSNVLGEQREIIVGVPAGYEGGDETYPVVYLLDGPSHFHHTTGTARFLARNGRMPDVIVVAIPNTDRTRDLSPPVYSDAGPARSSSGGADDPVALYVAGGLEAIDRHFARASARFGYERTPSTGVLGRIGGKALEDGNADPRNRPAREKLTEYGVDLSDFPETVDVPVRVLESYVGTYVVPDDPDERLRLVLAGEELAVELEGSTYELYATSMHRFKVVVVPVYLTFRTDEAGNVTGLTIDQAGEKIEAIRVKTRASVNSADTGVPTPRSHKH